MVARNDQVQGFPWAEPAATGDGGADVTWGWDFSQPEQRRTWTHTTVLLGTVHGVPTALVNFNYLPWQLEHEPPRALVCGLRVTPAARSRWNKVRRRALDDNPTDLGATLLDVLDELPDDRQIPGRVVDDLERTLLGTRHRGQTAERLDRTEDVHDPRTGELHLVDPDAEDPFRDVEKQSRERVTAALQQLTRQQQQLVELLYFEGLPQRVVAERLDISQSAVSQRRKTVMHRLKELLS